MAVAYRKTWITLHMNVKSPVNGKDNGQYPYNYKEMIDNIFGVANNAVEVCSNSIKKDDSKDLCDHLTTVDIRPETNPDYVADGSRICQMFRE